MNRPSNNLDHLKERIATFIAERDWDQFHSCKNLAISILLEAAELLELFQWTDPALETVKTDPKLMPQLGEELADIAIYVISFANKLGLDLGTHILVKLEKNEKKYPIPESIGRVDKYHEYFSLKGRSPLKNYEKE